MAQKGKKQYIKIRGANEHNLKNVSVDIPRDGGCTDRAEWFWKIISCI